MKPNLYSFNKKWTEMPKDYSVNNQNERRDNINLSQQESAISKVFKGLKSKQININMSFPSHILEVAFLY